MGEREMPHMHNHHTHFSIHTTYPFSTMYGKMAGEALT